MSYLSPLSLSPLPLSSVRASVLLLEAVVAVRREVTERVAEVARVTDAAVAAETPASATSPPIIIISSRSRDRGGDSFNCQRDCGEARDPCILCHSTAAVVGPTR